MGVDVAAMATAMQTALDAVTPPAGADPTSMAAYRGALTAAMAAGIAAGVDPVIGTGGSGTDVTNIQNTINYIVNNGPFELEIMRLSFYSISWAQFAIFDNFADSSKRIVVEPSGSPAAILTNSIIQGDATPGKSFLFTTRTYAGITTIGSGTLAVVSSGVFQDTAAKWFTNEIKGLLLVDHLGAIFTVASNTSNTFTVAGTAFYPAAGAYSLNTGNPANMVAMASYKDSTINGGFGFTKLEVSFDGGTHWQLLLDTSAGVDHTGGNLAIANPGSDYIARITITNDEGGAGPTFSDFLIATDPSPWRF